jgi:preprotein translocase subunit SecA
MSDQDRTHHKAHDHAHVPAALPHDHGHDHVHGHDDACGCGHDHHHHHHGHAVETFRRASPKIGRNDPCSCGSGKKYKKCCLDAA